LILIGSQAEGDTILEAVAMETAIVETMATEPAAEAATVIAPGQEL
jgi:hypothetical protein